MPKVIKKAEAEAFPVMVKRDFVYRGRREGRLGIALVEIAVIDDANGLMLDPQVFAAAKYWQGRVIGGLYRGASFGGNQAAGLGAADFVTAYGTPEDRWNWRAADEAFMVSHRRKKNEERLRKTDDVLLILRPLRREFEALMGRYDMIGADAFRQMIDRAIRTPLKASEK